MGQWDHNNYLAVIKVRDNITDPVYKEYCIRTDLNVSLKEYQAFEREHPIATHPAAVKALDFICTYKDGMMKPDKWGFGEPLKRIFDDSSPQLLITYLTRPGGKESVKKRRFYDANLNNTMWCNKEPISISMRKNVLPEYMFSITFYFSKSLKNIYSFIEELVKDFSTAIQTDFGQIIDQSTMEVIFDISKQQ